MKTEKIILYSTISILLFCFFYVAILIYKERRYDPIGVDIFIINNSPVDYKYTKSGLSNVIQSNDTILYGKIYRLEVADINTLICKNHVSKNDSIYSLTGEKIRKDFNDENNWNKEYKSDKELVCYFFMFD